MFDTKILTIICLAAAVVITAEQFTIIASVCLGGLITIAVFYKWIWRNKLMGIVGFFVLLFIALALTSDNLWINRVLAVAFPIIAAAVFKYIQPRPVPLMQPVIDKLNKKNK